jgi:hypothetical protein
MPNGKYTPVDCTPAYKAGETCREENPYASSKLEIISGLAVNTCGAFSDTFYKASGFGSMKIVPGLSTGAIIGIIIGAIALMVLSSIGCCHWRKTGPYAPNATWATYGASWAIFLKISSPATSSTASKDAPAAGETTHNPGAIVIRAVEPQNEKA